ncbi:chromosome partitioning protein, ParB family [Clostridium collagenovorans DSM 3089]|uniref:Chromosome partitioning protein, ParB family n=1 Tax=Clostridium collagenovorans DSM 3089 TaxID=1121306 RepID=A0A1M5YGT0_9CLOT|nr:ParB/RepB/Spo0J family partition protein [Clostridium collagenovorans]SHI11068.1 chromosome partitioning protein, ParB family [Clostridium collagenovorans DSM 3089]
MNKKHGLGRGLGALIPDNKVVETPNNSLIKEVREINKNEKENSLLMSINKIKANSKQPRKNFDNDKIDTLASSIKQHGIIQPLLVRRDRSEYIVIAGERRWRAAKKIGLKEVPVIVVEDIDDKKVLELSLIENIQREDLNPIEEALAYEELKSKFNLTQEQLSERIGKSRTAITNCLRLLNLDVRVQEYIIDGIISEGHGRTILAMDDKEIQYKIAQKIIDEDLSVRETERLIKVLKEGKKESQPKEKEFSPYFKDIENRLQDHFGTKVSLSCNNKQKGKIQIEYYSQDELQRILEILKIAD